MFTSKQAWPIAAIVLAFVSALGVATAVSNQSASLFATAANDERNPDLETDDVPADSFDTVEEVDYAYTVEEELVLDLGHRVSGMFGTPASDAEWIDIAELNCDVPTDATEFYLPNSTDLDDQYSDSVLAYSLAVSWVAMCPERIDEQLGWDEFESALAFVGYDISPPQDTVESWRTIPDGDGYRVQCNDGTWSNSGGIQGACSWHGGVAE